VQKMNFGVTRAQGQFPLVARPPEACLRLNGIDERLDAIDLPFIDTGRVKAHAPLARGREKGHDQRSSCSRDAS